MTTSKKELSYILNTSFLYIFRSNNRLYKKEETFP